MTIEELAAIDTIDLTTIGRHSGSSRRVEIWWFHIDGRFIITGTPGPRDWYANILDNPRVIIHVGGEDIDALAIPVLERSSRRSIMTDPTTSWYQTQADLAELVASAPVIELDLVVTERPHSVDKIP